MRQAATAEQLVSWNEKSHEFDLHTPGLKELETVPRSEEGVSVIAVVGSARHGKSTTLNALCALDEKPFSTSDGCVADTRGVLIHTDGNRVLLDLEGHNLGREDVIDQLSALAGLLASELVLFVSKRPMLEDIHYLLRFSLLMKNITRTGASISLPRLHVVVREPLQGVTQAFVHKYLLVEDEEDQENEARRELMACFGSVIYHQLPHVLDQDAYAHAIASLNSTLNQCKSTPLGTKLDGKSLAEMVGERLFERIQTMDYTLDTIFRRVESSACHRARERWITPLSELEEVDDFDRAADSALAAFMESCRLPDEVAAAREFLDLHAQHLQLKESERTLQEELKEENLRMKREEQKLKYDLARSELEEAGKEADREHEREQAARQRKHEIEKRKLELEEKREEREHQKGLQEMETNAVLAKAAVILFHLARNRR